MAYFNENPINQPQDKQENKETFIEIKHSATSKWNEEGSRRSERIISSEELAERKKVENLPYSIGRGFDKLPTVQNVGDWYDNLVSY